MEQSPAAPPTAMLGQPVPTQLTPKHVKEPGSSQPSPVQASRGIQLDCGLVTNNMYLVFYYVATAD